MMNKMMNSMVNTMNVMNLMNTIKNANVPNQIVNKINPNSNVPVVKTNQSNPDTEDRFSRIESLMKAFQQNTLTSNVKGRKSTIRKFMKQIDFDGVKIENKLLTSKLEEDNEERDDEEIYSILKEVKC